MQKALNFFPTSDVAKRLGVHPKTVSRLLRQGKVAGVKVANRWLLEKATLETLGKTYVGKKGRPKGWSPKKEAAE